MATKKGPQQRLRLKPKDVDKIAKLGEAPYFDLYVTAPPPTGEVLTYVGTTEQELMYDPQTYLIDYKSNLSTVIVLTYESPNVYTISSKVLPDNVLMPTTVMSSSTPDTVYEAKFLINATTKFTTEYDTGIGKYAFYTDIGSPSNTEKAYLLPMLDPTQTGPLSKVIRAVVTEDQSATGKYVFDMSQSDYTEQRKLVTDASKKYASKNNSCKQSKL